MTQATAPATRTDAPIIMGGDFSTDEPEHNLLCDVTAAQAVFAAGVPAVVTGIDQTERVILTEAQLGSIAAAGALGELLVAEIELFRSWLGRPDSPHDPIAVLAVVRPELFTFVRGRIHVSADGRTRLEPRDDGPHQVAVDLDLKAVADELVTRICRLG